jgi:acetoin utilization deacetylase AcuC-like enzyme
VERPVIFYDPVYTDGLSPEARFPRDRYREVREALEGRGVDARARFAPSPVCAEADLHLVHEPAYVTAFLEGALDARAARRIGLRPWTDRIGERTLKILGGSVAATHALLSEHAGVAGNLAGGTHHAFRGEGAGYCVFNDVAVCARVAMRDHGVERVLVLDLDVHQGDGTAAIFEDEPRVFTCSLHCQENFPFRKQRSDLDIALPKGTGDAGYLDALDRVLSRTFTRHRPELLIYQAGVDPLAEDRLGRLELTREGLQERNARVYAEARARGIPTLVLMGGGYAEPLEPTVTALADVFEQAVDTWAA